MEGEVEEIEETLGIGEYSIDAKLKKRKLEHKD